jgi:hypothetical protein
VTEKNKGPRLILLTRHTEKPARSLGEPGLSALGAQHALELATQIPILYGIPDVVFAAASDAESSRCVETATPIVDLHEIPFFSNIPAGNVDRLVYAIENQPYGDFVLVVWRHEQLSAISAALGFPPPFKKWPQENYSTMWALSHDFDYFENDNAYYRARHGTGLAAVDEVWTPGGWENYRGDKSKPWCFGSKITKAQLPVEAQSKRRVLPPGFREVGAPGDAFIIPGFPKSS